MLKCPFSLVIALSAINSGAVVALVGVAVYLALRVGRLPTRQEHNELCNEIKADLAQLRACMREDMTQLCEEFRRSHQQMMLALVNNSHREDGQPVFTLPSEMEITPARRQLGMRCQHRLKLRRKQS